MFGGILSGTQRSYTSYHRNKTKVARQRILNAIDKGKCVLRRTLEDPKYNWNEDEKRMMEKCLENRRARYVIDPKDITYIRDHRFRKVYPSDNYKEFHEQQVQELLILEDKLKTLTEFVKKLEGTNAGVIARHEIARLEKEIKKNNLERQQPTTRTHRKPIPFNNNSPDNSPDNSTSANRNANNQNANNLNANNLNANNLNANNLNANNLNANNQNANNQNANNQNANSQNANNQNANNQNANRNTNNQNANNQNANRNTNNQNANNQNANNQNANKNANNQNANRNTNRNTNNQNANNQNANNQNANRNTNNQNANRNANHLNANNQNANRNTNNQNANNQNANKNTNNQNANKNTNNQNANSQNTNSQNTSTDNVIFRPSKHNISFDDVVKTYTFMIETNLMYARRNEYTKRKGISDYKRYISNMFTEMAEHSSSTINLYDVYMNPLVYKDMTKNKKIYLQILYKLYAYSDTEQFDVEKVPHGVYNLSKNVANIQTFRAQFSYLNYLAKRSEEDRMRNAEYFDWEDIKKVVSFIKGNSLRDMMDRILILIYVEENIVRDNLGCLSILEYKPTEKVSFNFVYKGDNGRFMIVLNDFKNVGARGEYVIKMSKRTSKYIIEYIDAMQAHLDKRHNGKKLKFLFTQINGNIYKHCKLSGYILNMFNRHTGAQGLGINELRHSVATAFKDADIHDKCILAEKMQHSLEQHLKYERHSNLKKTLPILRYKDSNGVDKLIGQTVEVLHNNQIVGGVIELNTDVKTQKKRPYTVVLDDPGIKQKKYSLDNITTILSSNNVYENIGRRVKYSVLKHQKPLYGSNKIVEGVLQTNPLYEYDLEVDPYIIKFDNTLFKSIPITLPNCQVENI
uniref:Uncharacterized protein n=1 Tax=Pyramimonas orientalis virus TaxID=455367 RepID=A0A7L9AZ00_POV01|nr:hypothetical protein HWQ62_00385 [Pyramimonas orientalis virus]